MGLNNVQRGFGYRDEYIYNVKTGKFYLKAPGDNYTETTLPGNPETGSATAGETHAFILAGQSNMVGRATYDGGSTVPPFVQQVNQSGDFVLPTYPLRHVDPNDNNMGPDITFLQQYTEAHPEVNIVVIPSADGGTGFSDNNWNPGNTIYELMVSRVNAAFQDRPEMILKGFLWHQGERDSSQSISYYQTRWEAMLADAISRIPQLTESTPIVLGGIYDKPAYDNINKALELIADSQPNRAFASSVGLTSFDGGTHFDSASYRLLGERYFEGYASLAGTNPTTPAPEPEPEPPSDITAEAGAEAHWIWGSDNATNADLVSGKTAVPNNVTISSNYVRIQGDLTVGPLSNLMTDISIGQEKTIINVVKTPSGGNRMICGNLVNDSSEPGTAVYMQFDGLKVNNRAGAGSATITNPSGYFMHVLIITSTELTSWINPGDSSARKGVTSGSNPVSVSNDPLAIGNGYYDSPGWNTDTLDIAETIVFDSPLSEAEISAIFTRSQARMGERGITI